ncbi:MAG: ferrous iron transport protein A [Christensenellaceae bacterium]|jgi:Fe2+ transport system protein FeoA|nr:ferrous iron transport protein A [Christensenellaceae bacterium]
MLLNGVAVGQRARIISVNGPEALKHHILEMGLTPDTEVFVMAKAPLGDPLQLFVRGYQLSMRAAEAAFIEVKPKEGGK